MDCRFRPAALVIIFAFASMFAEIARAQEKLEPDQLPLTSAPSAQGRSARLAPRFLGPSGASTTVAPGTVSGAASSLDTVATFSGSFTTGLSTARMHWFYRMVGHNPSLALKTTVNAPIIPVSLDLRNADGSPRFVNGHRLFYDVNRFIGPLLASPIFQNAKYSSSIPPTQFVDAVQRAEFFHKAPATWHTILKPRLKTTRVMKLRAGSYQFALLKDGTCCAYVLVDFSTFESKLLPSSASDTSSIFGAALHSGEIRTRDVTTFFFPNTFLSNNDSFFLVGFHSFVSLPGTVENGNRQRLYVMNYSSWVTPFIFFGDAFQDVTVVSHELSELVNDPFLANTTPWWLSPNGNCQNILETGDVTEDLPNSTFPVTINGRTFHPQNEALLEWFEFQKPSHAIAGAYSYPDERLLMSLSPPEQPGCP